MIVVITTLGHGSALASLTEGKFGFPIPQLVLQDYDTLLGRRRFARATYIFADLECLAPWELRGAAELFRMLTEQGLRCLNDPARVMCRVELLQTLNAKGLNPFNVLRADESPKPARFPVFLRYEDNHRKPLSPLLNDQHELETELANLRAAGVPLRGIVVVEFCSQPYSEGLWHKWGTFRVGANISVDHLAVDDNWLVKFGVWEKLTDVVIDDEREAVKSNRFADVLMPAFDLAGIDYGRADHATIDERTVVYEINTNPYIGPYVPDPNPLRRETQIQARQRFAAALDAIDTVRTGTVKIPKSRIMRRRREVTTLGWRSWLNCHRSPPLVRP